MRALCNNSSNGFAKNRGSVFIEFVIILPLFVFISLAAADIGRALKNYMLLEHLVAEAVRTSATSVDASKPDGLNGRLTELMALYHLPIKNTVIHSTMSVDASGTTFISASVSGAYDGLCPFLDMFTFKSEKKGPYLLIS